MLDKGTKILVKGQVKTVNKYQAEWSLALSTVPHKIWVLWEGESKYQVFTSDSDGEFHDLALAED